jgi:hypothetical protein
VKYQGVWVSSYEWLQVTIRQHEVVIESLEPFNLEEIAKAANEYGATYDGFTPFNLNDPELGVLGVTSAAHRHLLLKPGYLVVTDGVNCVFIREYE